MYIQAAFTSMQVWTTLSSEMTSVYFIALGLQHFILLIFVCKTGLFEDTYKLSVKCFQFINVLYLPYSVKFLLYSIPMGRKYRGLLRFGLFMFHNFFVFSILNASDSNMDTFLLSYSISLDVNHVWDTSHCSRDHISHSPLQCANNAHLC